MENIIKIPGVLLFDPKEVTTKQSRQGEWKKTAMVMFPGDIHKLYCWFLKKRYNLILQYPMRGAHISFINDRASDMNGKWEEIKKKWNGHKIEVILDIDPRSDELNWWLNIPEEHRTDLHGIRAELGLGRPHWGLHMTIGTAVDFKGRNEKGINAQTAMMQNETHSKYIVNLIRNGYIKHE